MTNINNLATAIRTHVTKEPTVLSKEQQDNYRSHFFGSVDDYYGCVVCDISVWNAHKRPC